MTDRDLLEATAKYLHLKASDIHAHRVDRQEKMIVVVVGAGHKFRVPLADLDLDDHKKAVREPTTIPDPPISPIGPLQPLFTLFSEHLSPAAVRILQEHDLLDAAKLQAATDEILLQLPGIGPKTVRRIRQILAEGRAI